MAFLRKGKQGRAPDAGRDSPRAAPSAQSPRHDSAPAGPSRLQPGLERRWEEAWRRARAGST